MNISQQKHIIRRIKDIADRKKNEIRKRLPNINDKPLTVEKFVKLVRGGKVKPYEKSKGESVSRVGIPDAFDVSEYHHPVPYGKAAYDVDEYNRLIAPIILREQELIDEIVLGDATEALKMIRDFEK